MYEKLYDYKISYKNWNHVWHVIANELKKNLSSQIQKIRLLLFQIFNVKKYLWQSLRHYNDNNSSYYCYITQLKQLDEMKATAISMQLHCRKYVTTPEISNFESNYEVERVLSLVYYFLPSAAPSHYRIDAMIKPVMVRKFTLQGNRSLWR